jgi:hypothetical protein
MDDETETRDEETTEEAASEPPVRAGYPHVEAMGSGGEIYVWECSEGDMVSRSSAAAVTAHIKDVHGDAKSAKPTVTAATAAPARQATRRSRRR